MTAGTPGALAAADETAVVALARNGDDRAFDELVRRRQAHIRSLLRRLCRDAALANDLAQDTFLQAWRQLERLKADVAFGSWLRQIAVNAWLQHLRRVGPGDSAAAQTEPWTLPAFENAIDLDDALARLQPAERLCVVLSYGEEMSHSEIATATSLPLGTVKTLIARGSSYLRELLAEHASPGDSP